MTTASSVSGKNPSSGRARRGGEWRRCRP
uniref:Uncharacterized protein n=1 Tax=Arundo donax TaxID=35708 RepID=A0A0A9E6J4_ARUDO